MGDLNQVISAAELAKHNTASDCWLVIHGKVYDVTKFLEDHPGGDDVLIGAAGTDATDDFVDVGHSQSANEQLEQFLVGVVAEDYYSSAGVTARPDASTVTPTASTVTPTASFSGNAPAAQRQMMTFLKLVVPILLLLLAFALRFFKSNDGELTSK